MRSHLREIIIVLAVIVAFASVTSYILWQDNKRDSARVKAVESAAYDRGFVAADKQRFDFNYNELTKVQDDYNQLVSDYNSLYESASQYVNTTQYKPLNCTSYSYGTDNNFTSTNCY